MEPPEGWDPYGRPARRTQWLVSALAYHYGLDRGVENEIVVLATGLDQYLQEIFHHLDCAGEGRIPGEDFRTLCQVLGLGEEAAADPEERLALREGLAAELTFRQFHARLCGYFSTRAGSAPRRAVPRLPLGRESEHIETQIRLRSPRRRRRDAAGAGAGAGQGSAGRRGGGGGSAERRPAAPCSRECYEEIVALEQAEDRIAKLEEENGSLRELVEDMRAALQSSDARCLALQVSARGRPKALRARRERGEEPGAELRCSSLALTREPSWGVVALNVSPGLLNRRAALSLLCQGLLLVQVGRALIQCLDLTDQMAIAFNWYYSFSALETILLKLQKPYKASV